MAGQLLCYDLLHCACLKLHSPLKSMTQPSWGWNDASVTVEALSGSQLLAKTTSEAAIQSRKARVEFTQQQRQQGQQGGQTLCCGSREHSARTAAGGRPLLPPAGCNSNTCVPQPWVTCPVKSLRTRQAKHRSAPLALGAQSPRHAHRDDPQALHLCRGAVICLTCDGCAGDHLHLAHNEYVPQRVSAVGCLRCCTPSGRGCMQATPTSTSSWTYAKPTAAVAASGRADLLEALQAGGQARPVDVQEDARLQAGAQEAGAPGRLQHLVHLAPAAPLLRQECAQAGHARARAAARAEAAPQREESAEHAERGLGQAPPGVGCGKPARLEHRALGGRPGQVLPGILRQVRHQRGQHRQQALHVPSSPRSACCQEAGPLGSPLQLKSGAPGSGRA